MKRWAELLIKKVHKDEHGRVQKVKVGIDVVSRVLGDVELTKEEVISILKDGSIIKTTYMEDNKYVEGATVTHYKESNGVEYLRTNSNKTSKDNLDNLPIF